MKRSPPEIKEIVSSTAVEEEIASPPHSWSSTEAIDTA